VALNFLTSPVPVFVAGVAADAAHNVVYISESPGTANATIYRFDAGTITAASPGGGAGVVYVTNGRMPAAGTPEATVYCSLTCTRPADPALTPGGTTGFPFAQGLYVDPTTSRLYVTEDATAGARSGRGHLWQVPYIP
jgi:DNA-binding beta-propeller fold protein YncE